MKAKSPAADGRWRGVVSAQRLAHGPMGQAALKEVVMQGSVLRLRPKLMTVATNVIGFLPLLWAKGAGRLKAREAGEYL